MKVLMLISDGMEECEALVTRDVLIRSGIEVIMFPTNNKKEILSSHKLVVKADINKYPDLNQFDALILPGGGLGTKNLNNYQKMDEMLAHFMGSNKLVAAICAAPTVLGYRGYLKGKQYTCFSGCQEGIDGNYIDTSVCICQNIITGRSMYYSADFGLAIVSYLLGKDAALDTEKKIKSL